MRPALALLPLRLFLGATFVYAGIQKLSDPGFLHDGAPTYIGTQLDGFADGTPGGFLLRTLALPQPELAGVGVAVLEIAIGALVLLGVLTRSAAVAGLLLNVLLFLTATWHTSPYFLGSDIVFVFAWLPLALAGAEGQPTVRDVLERWSLGVRRTVVRGRPVAVPELRQGEHLSRRAVLGHALGVAGLVTALAAAASTLARGSFRAPVARARSRGSGGGAGTDIGPASALAPGQAQTYLDSATQRPAVAVRAEDGSLFGLSAVCTHAGCELRFRAGALACPCHGSTFDVASGASQGGPARRPLDTGPVIERDGRLIAMPLRPGGRG